MAEQVIGRESCSKKFQVQTGAGPTIVCADFYHHENGEYKFYAEPTDQGSEIVASIPDKHVQFVTEINE